MWGSDQQRDTKQRKRDAVGNLRDLAQQYGLTPARRQTDMSRSAFETLTREVEAKALTPEHKSSLNSIKAAFLGSDAHGALPSIPPLPASAPHMATGSSASKEAPRSTFRLQSTSCLFTWNNNQFGSMDLEKLWQDFMNWLASLVFIVQFTATMERSLKSADAGRIHLHAFVEFRQAVDWTSVELMRFEGSLPNASATKARGENVRSVKDQGHFYAWAWKLGTLKVQTSGYEPWRDYLVKGYWIDMLWSEHKLGHEIYLDYAAKVRIGFVNRQKQVEALKLLERGERLRSNRALIAKQLAPLQKAFKPEVLARLEPWRQQYKSIASRYSFLVLRGASRTGKSTLARSLATELEVSGLPFVQTVQSAESPDLRNYDADFHSYIVFDNVNDAQFVLDQRALFQANNDVHTLGESKTGMYSYEVWLFRVPIVVTVDMSADWDPSEPWIKENCFDVLLQGPSWTD